MSQARARTARIQKISMLNILEYVSVTPQTHCAHTTGTYIRYYKPVLHTCLGQVTEAFSKPKINISETRNTHFAYTDVPKACAKHVQRVFKVPGIRQTPEIH